MGVKRVVARLLRRPARGRESASFGAAALGVLLIAGAVLGNGIARTAVDVADGLTWLGDDERGEVVQVNPASGRPETRLQVAGGTGELEITQRDGTLVVLDRRTGQITVIDLATLLASGRRQAPAGGTSKVVLSAGRLFIIDRAAGTVSNTDLVTLVDIGPPWQAGQPLADAVADEDGVVWAVDHGGTLYALEWSDADNKFTVRTTKPVQGAGPRTALVPHRAGVTLLGLEGGVVLRDGTGADLAASTDRDGGDLLAAQSSPADLAPASLPGSGKVVLVTGDQVLTVDVAAMGCPRPGRPAVFRGKVYTPCLGGGKVVVLDADGKRGADDVRTDGAKDPQLVPDDGKLFINAPGTGAGLVVDPDGKVRPIQVRSPDLQVTNPDRSPPPTPPSPPRPDPSEPTRTRPNQPPPTTQPTAGVGGVTETTGVSPAPTTTTPSVGLGGGAPGQPPGVTVAMASRDANGVTVTVSWGAAGENGSPIAGYAVTASGKFQGGSVSKQVGSISTQLTIPCAGTQFCQNGRLEVSVTAHNQSGPGTAGTASWAVPVATTQPPAPTTTTTPPTTQAPPPPTTTTPPPPPPTTTTPPPPPPPSVPTAGAAVISGITGASLSSRTISLAPPADWASHDGRCELVNLTYEYVKTIPCSATSTSGSVETGSNRFVVRAHAKDGSRSVDSAAKSTFVREPPQQCGQRICQEEPLRAESVDQEVGSGPMAGAGIGLLLTAVLLRVTGRRREERP